MATVLTITANPLIDYLATGELQLGAVNRVARLEPSAGGKSINAGRVLARHGHRVLAASFAGGEPGALLRQLLVADGLQPELVATAARTRIGFQVAHAGGSTAVLEDGFAVTPAEGRAMLDLVENWVRRVDLVLIGGSVADPSLNDLYSDVGSACAAAGVPCWLDAYGPAMQRALGGPHPPALAKPNRREYGDGRAFASCREVHVTDGPLTVEVRSPEGNYRVTPPPVREVNAIGSGDAYLAALAHARLSGLRFEEQLRYAAAAGAANAALGAVARIGPEDVARFIGGERVEQH